MLHCTQGIFTRTLIRRGTQVLLVQKRGFSAPSHEYVICTTHFGGISLQKSNSVFSLSWLSECTLKRTRIVVQNRPMSRIKSPRGRARKIPFSATWQVMAFEPISALSEKYERVGLEEETVKPFVRRRRRGQYHPRGRLTWKEDKREGQNLENLHTSGLSTLWVVLGNIAIFES